MDMAEGIRSSHLRLPYTVQSWIFPQNISDSGHRIRIRRMAKLLLHPPFQKRVRPVRGFRSPALKIVGQLHKVGKRQLHGLQVAHIDDPEIPDAIIVSHGHLLPNLLQRDRIDPFVGAGAAVVVEVVIDAPARRPAALSLLRQLADIAEVIVGENNGHIVQHLPLPQTRNGLRAVPEFLHFLVNSQRLRCMLQAMFAEQLLLGQNNILQPADILLQISTQGGILLPAHAQGDDIGQILIPDDAILPEPDNGVFVGPIIPQIAVPILHPFLLPFFARPEKGFMVRGSHYDPVNIRQPGIGQRRAFSVLAEDGAPHGGPQIIPLQPQQQLEHFFIHQLVEAAAAVHGPGAQ
ncbi:hypothetical protein D3C75_579180 [compost metagenome]